MKVDYIIIGCGLAGIAFCEQLQQHNKSFVVFDDHSQQSSIVATGLYNPVVLKRFNEVWESKKQLDLALPLYNSLEKRFGVQLDYKLPVYRRFASINEQNEWFTASDKPNLQEYLSPNLIRNQNLAIDAPFGFGEVKQTGRIDTALLLKNYKAYLIETNRYINKTFEYGCLKFKGQLLHYDDISATRIVFAEGFGMMKNPYFNTLPLEEAKGEIITIKAPDLKMEYILKSSVFIVPEGNALYSVGATYNWEDKTQDITESAKVELVDKLNTIIKCDYEVVGQAAGIRPTTKDRRPLIGIHPDHKNIAILNGLGTRGVMIGPYVALALYNQLENGKSLDPQIDINRFS